MHRRPPGSGWHRRAAVPVHRVGRLSQLAVSVQIGGNQWRGELRVGIGGVALRRAQEDPASVDRCLGGNAAEITADAQQDRGRPKVRREHWLPYAPDGVAGGKSRLPTSTRPLRPPIRLHKGLRGTVRAGVMDLG